MAIATGLYGPYNLTAQDIDARVDKKLGAYLLGDALAENGTALTIRYAGRDDVDVNGRLKSWVGKYNYFLYGHLATTVANYETESRLYHMFGGPAGGLDNKIHPAKPKGSTCTCPVCGA